MGNVGELLEHRRNEEILKEVKVEPIARRRYEKEKAGMVRARQKKR